MRKFFGRVSAAIARGFASAAAAIAGAIGPRELGLFAGLGLIGAGAGLVWLPAGLFLPGVVILYVTICGLKV